MANNFSPVGNELQIQSDAQSKSSTSSIPTLTILTDGRFFSGLRRRAI